MNERVVHCRSHGPRPACVVCKHMLDSSAVVGFVENSPGTDDLQAWCDACEAMFVEEGGMTERFLAFNGFSVVCADCFARLRTLHVKH